MAVRAANLDTQSLRDLYADVVTVARKIVGDEAAEDVAQETFLRLLAVEEPRRPRAWLAKVARNLAIDEIRRRRRATPSDVVPESSVDGPDVAELLSVRSAMSDLPERYRLLLWLKHVEGRTAADIAQITGATQSSVEMSLFRARRSLAESYSRRAALLSFLFAPLAAIRRFVVRVGPVTKAAVGLMTAAAVVGTIGPVTHHPPATSSSEGRLVAAAAGRAFNGVDIRMGSAQPTSAARPSVLGTEVSPNGIAIDRVIAEATMIVVGRIHRIRWQRSDTSYRLRTNRVWYGPADRNGAFDFVLSGHPKIGFGTNMLLFLAGSGRQRLLAAFVVKGDGMILGIDGRPFHLTVSDLEARIRALKSGRASPRGASPDARHDEASSRSRPGPVGMLEPMIAAVVRP